MLSHPLTASQFRENIKEFVKNGGGYIGTCGGASLACKNRAFGPRLRYTTPGNLLLGMVNATAVSRAFHEDRYGSKEEYNVGGGPPGDWEDWGGIPVPTYFYKENATAIFPDIDKYIDTRYGSSIRYWGGPAFIHLGSDVRVIAIYNREPSNDSTLRIHRVCSNEVISTSLRYKPAVISATYGRGRIILFGNHPELKSWKYGTGHVAEDEMHTKYLYVNNSNDQKYKPTFDTRGLIFDAAKWAVEPLLLGNHNESDGYLILNNNIIHKPYQNDALSAQSYTQTYEYSTADTKINASSTQYSVSDTNTTSMENASSTQNL